MHRKVAIATPYADATLNLAIDTLQHGKQALVFCNTKRGAESQAEKIAEKCKDVKDHALLKSIAEQILGAVNSPTKQCKRLAMCVGRGIAFHHSGLHSKQREIVETRFRDGTISIICATPTLAMGMDLPAYRSVIRDLKRYTQGTSWGMSDIPVLEYEQMSGRAGRPGKESSGQAICIAGTESEKERIMERYVHGEPESIYSKLAVEPVLRTYVLSLIASGYVHDRTSLYRFFDQTFYAFQYEDMDKLHGILDRMTMLLAEWGFIDAPHTTGEFMVASDMADGALAATPLGETVARLYLDPLTAHHLLASVERAMEKRLRIDGFPLLHLLCTTLEMRPLTSVRQAEIETVDATLVREESALLVPPPSVYSMEYEEFLQTVKTAMVFAAWVDEEGEDRLFEEHHVTPGELQAKRNTADWLLHSMVELVKRKGWHGTIVEFERMRQRIEYGAKEEVLPLLRLQGIGRVRARKLFQNGIRSIDAIKQAEITTLKALIGEAMAVSIKEQVGEKVRPEDIAVKRNKRKGQVNIGDFG
jgi:helicase